MIGSTATRSVRTSAGRRLRRLSSAVAVLVVPAAMLLTGLGPPAAAATDPCAVAGSVACENTKPGTPQSTWDVSGSGSSTIQGFATQMSVNRGQTESFKVKTTAKSYTLDIYRMGYYGGNGARLITTLIRSTAQTQPTCLSDSTTGLYDCGNWAVSASWAVPADAVSGIYFAKLSRTDGTTGTSHIFFVVRNDASTSDILYETSDTTWQAYNQYGGNSLYVGNPAGRAYKVSYNRPFTTRGTGSEDWVFNAEYPMVRFLEANGYDVTYTTGADTDRSGALIKNHKIFMSSGHDEYWSGPQRANVEAARDAGVSLAFFSGNEVFWKTRWENSIDSSATDHRTLVCYKETHADAVIDPKDPPTTTATWRDPRFGPPASTADGNRPENGLTGTIFQVNAGTLAMQVPAADGKMRFWRNTPVGSQAAGATATLADGTVGYEWDEDEDNGSRPAGLIDLSTTNATNVQVLEDYGNTFGNGNAVHHLTLYRAPSGALVFGAGTVQWSWGLDSHHDNGSGATNVSMQQATVNLFADMRVQPVTLIAGLVAVSASTDTTAPTTTISSPTAGASVQSGSAITVSGTATDTGGGVVGGIEVSTDGGSTWHPATGRGTWSYTWSPSAAGSATIKVRATDDSGNIGTPASVTVTVAARTCPCSVWSNSVVPGSPSDPDTTSNELGVKFTVDTPGSITGIRFYKGSGNTGTHIGHLWTSTGTQLASVTFSGESSTGWQQANFATPVSVSPGTIYVASYLAPNGHYAEDDGYFANSGVDASPLHLLKDGASGPNGVYAATASPGAFPTSTWASGNYWVDVVFTTSGGGTDTTPPTVTSTTPASGATGVATSTTVSATFSEPVQAGTITMGLKNAGGTAVTGTTAYDSATQKATFTPSSALATGTTYTATVSGAKDLAGNTMTSTSWSFTTSNATDTTPPTVTSTTPASGATGVATSTTVTATFSEPVQAGTITMGLKNAGGTAVTGTTSYNSSTQTATFTPSAALTAGTTYTATVSGAKDLANNTMTSTSWSFTTAAAPPPPSCPCSIWNSTATPANPSEADTGSVEVGVRFQADVPGKVTGVRFYKGTGNTGTHVGHLWSNTGTLLGTVTFSGETSTGWQQASFTTPVSIAANTTYVVSYYAPAGHYADDTGYFSTTGVDNSPLHALADGVSGADGVYAYGSGNTFPTGTWQSSNYWVDLAFAPN